MTLNVTKAVLLLSGNEYTLEKMPVIQIPFINQELYTRQE